MWRDAGGALPPPFRGRAIAYAAPRVVRSLPLQGGGSGWGSAAGTDPGDSRQVGPTVLAGTWRHGMNASAVSRVAQSDPHPNPPPFRGREFTACVAPYAIALLSGGGSAPPGLRHMRFPWA